MASRFANMRSLGRGLIRSPVETSPPASNRRRAAIFHRDGYRCVYCGQLFPDHELTLDHVQPRAKHGDRSAGNLVTACGPCNVRKGTSPAWKYLRERPVERSNFLRYAVHIWPRHRQAVIEAAP